MSDAQEPPSPPSLRSQYRLLIRGTFLLEQAGVSSSARNLSVASPRDLIAGLRLLAQLPQLQELANDLLETPIFHNKQQTSAPYHVDGWGDVAAKTRTLAARAMLLIDFIRPHVRLLEASGNAQHLGLSVPESLPLREVTESLSVLGELAEHMRSLQGNTSQTPELIVVSTERGSLLFVLLAAKGIALGLSAAAWWSLRIIKEQQTLRAAHATMRRHIAEEKLREIALAAQQQLLEAGARQVAKSLNSEPGPEDLLRLAVQLDKLTTVITKGVRLLSLDQAGDDDDEAKLPGPTDYDLLSTAAQQLLPPGESSPSDSRDENR